MDLPTLILSDDEEELAETGTIIEAAAWETEVEGTKNIEAVAYSSPSLPSSSSSGTEASTPSMPHCGGKGLMGHSGLLDAKAIMPEAFKVSSFEQSTGRSVTRRRFLVPSSSPSLRFRSPGNPSPNLSTPMTWRLQRYTSMFHYYYCCYFF